MTFAKTRMIGYFRSRLQRLVRLGRAHGQTRVAYRIARKLTSLPILKKCVRFSVVEALTASTDELLRTLLLRGRSGATAGRVPSGCSSANGPSVAQLSARFAGRIPKGFVVEKSTDEQELADYFGHAELVRERLALGDLCIVTRCHGKIGAGVWLRVGPNDYDENVDELGCVVRFPAGVVWSYDGKGTKWGAWGALMARLPQFLAELHVDEVYTLIDYDNQESLAGHFSLGYHRAGLADCIALFGLSATVCRFSGQRWHLVPGRVGKLQFIHGGKPLSQADSRTSGT